MSCETIRLWAGPGVATVDVAVLALASFCFFRFVFRRSSSCITGPACVERTLEMEEAESLDDVAAMMSAMISEVQRMGFRTPIQMVTIGANGSILAGRYVDGPSLSLEFEQTVEFIQGDGFLNPVNVILIDSATGKAAKLTMKREDDGTLSWVN